MTHSKNTAARRDVADRDARQRSSPPSMSVAWKWAISGLVVLHLLAVTAEPFRFFTRSARGTSPAADPVRWVLSPYIELAYLNHGYFFFAPEPGPSHLMECRLEMPDASQVSVTFPDKRKQWPRLLYHRHFMLAEFLHQLHVPPVDLALVESDPALAEAWQAERSLFERVRNSMSEHVTAKFGARSTSIQRIEHRLPSDEEVFRQRLALDSPALYVVLPDAPPTLGPPPASQLPSWGWQGMGVLINPLQQAEPQEQAGAARRPGVDRNLLEVQPIPLRSIPVEPSQVEPVPVGASPGESPAIEPAQGSPATETPAVDLEVQP